VSPSESSEQPVFGRTATFATTHWSVVLAAGQDESTHAAAALEQLCRAYWYPLYAFVRRYGYHQEDAQDVVQEFFARLLAKDYLARANPHKGRFRSFLLTALKNLLCDEHDKASRLKHGGGQAILSLDAQVAEDRYRLEPADAHTPEQLYERSWAAALLERAAGRLQEAYAAGGRAELFEQLTGFRLDADEPRAYAEAAAQLGLTESAVKSAIRRMRHRHQELVRDEIAQTLVDPAEMDDEIRHLLNVISR